jgi:hypothetical protein
VGILREKDRLKDAARQVVNWFAARRFNKRCATIGVPSEEIALMSRWARHVDGRCGLVECDDYVGSLLSIEDGYEYAVPVLQLAIDSDCAAAILVLERIAGILNFGAHHVPRIRRGLNESPLGFCATGNPIGWLGEWHTCYFTPLRSGHHAVSFSYGNVLQPCA